MEDPCQSPLLKDDDPILAAPSGDCDMAGCVNSYRPVCLGCFKSLRIYPAPYCCSRCGWAICNYSCEQESFHSTLECLIFHTNGIQPSYEALKHVFVLRALLLQDKFPHRWEKLMTLQHEFSDTAKNQDPEVVEMYRLSTWFIQDCCRMLQTDTALIKRIVNLKIIHSLAICKSGSVDCGPAKRYYGIAIFDGMSVFPHSCYPTVEWAIVPTTCSANSNSVVQLYLTTVREPYRLETTTIARDKNCLVYGTAKRQEILQKRFGIFCKCYRCTDPTENGSYFSSIICQFCHPPGHHFDGKKPLGFLLNENPVDDHQDSKLWKCSICQTVRQHSEVQGVVKAVEKELNDILDSLWDDEVVMNMLEQFLLSFAGRVLHQNHYLVIEAERNWMECYSILRKLKIPGKQANQLYSMLTKAAQHCLHVYSLILSSPYLELAMMVHMKLVTASQIFYFRQQPDEEENGNRIRKSLKRSLGSDFEKDTDKTIQTGLAVMLEKAVASHSFNGLPQSPFAAFRKHELLKQKRQFNSSPSGP